jgi:hypothetical protein
MASMSAVFSGRSSRRSWSVMKFVADKPPPAHVIEQVALMAAGFIVATRSTGIDFRGD